MTDYVILLNTTVDSQKPEWRYIGKAAARSANAAIRERIDGTQQSSEHYGDGEYVAVPLRSWQPVTVKTETKTQLKFS